MGPILIDLDFEIEKTETERFLDQSICFDMIDCYIENILKYFQIENDAEFEVFLLMKDEMNFDNNDYNKDGVHIQINLLMEHREQMFLREKTMKQINEDIIIPSGWNTFLKGDVEKIFDKSISSGMTGWLCYGSRKPGGKPYKLVNKYRVTVNDINEDPVDYSIEEISVSKKEYGKLFKDLLIRNCKHDKIKLKKEYEKSIVKKTKKAENKIIKKNTIGSSLILQNFKNIKTEEDCLNMINIILENDITSNINKIEEINDYLTNCIGEDYYVSRTPNGLAMGM